MAMEWLTLGGFVLSARFLTAAFNKDPRPLDKTRSGCLALTGAVLCAALVGRSAGWITTLSCLAFLMSLIAVALAAYAERAEPESDRIGAEPTWWPQFERDFREYVRCASTEERQDDSHRAP